MTFDRTALERFRHLDARGSYSRQRGSEVDADPYETFARFRLEGDIVASDLHRALGIDTSIGTTIVSGGYVDVEADRIFSAVSYEAVSAVSRSDRFANSAHARALDPFLGRTLISMDGVEHRRNRGLVAPTFSRRAIGDWTATAVAPAVKAGIEALLGVADRSNGRVDLLDNFILDVPARIIVAILGLDDDDTAVFTNAAMTMVTFSDPILALEASAVLRDWIASITVRARQRPEVPTLISHLAHIEVEGERLSIDEIAAFVRLLFVGGFETVVKGFSNVMVGLLSSQQWRLLTDSAACASAIEEGLRWETPVLGMPRTALKDQELFGVLIPEGSVVLCFAGSANRDERRWSHADRYDLTREQKPHLTFGLGAHLCIGMTLARVEMGFALSALRTALPDMVLDGDCDEDIRIRGLASRGPRVIPVVIG